jgi:hypothetical protein
MFTALPDQNTPVEVVLTSVTDVKNATVKPDVAKSTHLRTIHAIPAIEFTQALKQKYYASKEITAYNGSASHLRVE